MAINYTKIGWDTTKYVNPTSMNQMDDGIKAACDGVDTLDATVVKKTGATMTGALTINVDATYPFVLRRANATGAPNLLFANNSGNLGAMAVNPSTGRLIYAPSGGTSQQLAYVSEIPTNYVKLSDSAIQTITNTGAGRTVFVAKSGVTTGALVGFQDNNGTELGWLGVNSSKKPVFWDSSEHQLIQLDTLKSVVAASTDFANFKTRIAAL